MGFRAFIGTLSTHPHLKSICGISLSLSLSRYFTIFLSPFLPYSRIERRKCSVWCQLIDSITTKQHSWNNQLLVRANQPWAEAIRFSVSLLEACKLTRVRDRGTFTALPSKNLHHCPEQIFPSNYSTITGLKRGMDGPLFCVDKHCHDQEEVCAVSTLSLLEKPKL